MEIKSYFFVPVDNEKYIKKIPFLKVSEIVLDLEDSISKENSVQANQNINSIQDKANYWVRILINEKSEFSNLIKLGYRKFVLPKVESINDLKTFEKNSSADECKFILLVETVKCYMDIKELLSLTSLNIIAISLGAQDFIRDLNLKNNLETIKSFRQNIVLYARYFGIEAIDVASMEINDSDSFRNEIIEGFNMGYRSKFFIHPKQIEILENIELYDDVEVKFTKRVLKEYPDINEDIGALMFDGKVLEKPHVKRILEIKKWLKYES